MLKSVASKNKNLSPSIQSLEIKNRNDPGRFFGDGVTFKAKLIGILEVGEARGDRMCQEALQDLKMAIRAAGEHKQRITIHVTIDGLRLRDEKTGDSLYHHPVHKISFIAQDMTDSRAFGYIFGSPDSGHRFFGIKTDKAASQVVLAMRDLFQVVFELKKKEIELARQQIQSKTIHEHQPLPLLISGGNKSTSSDTASNLTTKNSNDGAKAITKEPNLVIMSPESVADLVDLEQELSSIQRGITQMERITPSEPTPTSKNFGDEDPFGDSFTNFPTYNLLPPPESSSSRSRHSKPMKPPDTSNTNNTESITTKPNIVNSTRTQSPPSLSTLLSSSTGITTNTPNLTSNTQNNENWLNELETADVFKNDSITSSQSLEQSTNIVTSATISNATQGIDEIQLTTASVSILKSDVERSTGTTTVATTTAPDPTMIARDTDPFSPTRKKSDPFQDGDIFSKLDPFEFEFSKSKILPETKITSSSSITTTTTTTAAEPHSSKDTSSSSTTTNVFNGPLQVNLPPEIWSNTSPTILGGQSYIGGSSDTSIYGQRLQRQSSESPTSSTARNRPSVFKQNTVDVISSISTKKMPHLFGQKFSKRDSHSINMRRLQESDSLSENETAPEPPPRPDSSGFSIEPPPLPPKKQFSDIVIRPRITSSSAIHPPPTRYDYVQAKIKSSQLSASLDSSSSSSAPPIPLPSRRIGRTDSSYPGPGRPRKPGCDEDDYLAPISTNRGDVPSIAPPPQSNKSGRPRRQETIENKNVEADQHRYTAPIELEQEPILPDITLSQLLTLGVNDLAKKLNVPASKLNTMTLVELTTYLSEFIEHTKKKPDTKKHLSSSLNSTSAGSCSSATNSPPVFKVNFDQNNDATFIAKFDDNFGDDSSINNSSSSFIANFSHFDNIRPEPLISVFDSNISTRNTKSDIKIVPSADRYAVFREIIDQELKNDSSTEIKSSPEEEDDEFYDDDEENSSPIQQQKLDNEYSDEDKGQTGLTTEPKMKIKIIDTKITEAISHAKDRYAALRDIILVEDLFEKPKQHQPSFDHFTSFGETNFSSNDNQNDLFNDDSFPTNFDNPIDIEETESTTIEHHHNQTEYQMPSDIDNEEKFQTQRQSNDSSPDSNQNFDNDLLESEPKAEIINSNISKQNNGSSVSLMQTLNVANNKDDLEIDELMNRAISNLSLDSREHLSPKIATMTKSPIINENQMASPTNLQQQQQQPSKSPLSNLISIAGKSQFSDVSTSPIPIQKSPSTLAAIEGDVSVQKSPSQLLISNSTTAKSPISKSPKSRSPILQSSVLNGLTSEKLIIAGQENTESWAVFEKPIDKKENILQNLKSQKPPQPKDLIGESPCSSDGKDDWKTSGSTGRPVIPTEGVIGNNNKRWPKGQTSSSSRDLSPWDDETPNEYNKNRPIPGPVVPDRHGYYMRHSRRMNSCDDDYDYDEEMYKRRERKIKSGISRSRDNFEFESPSWYQSGAMHHSWSPQDEDDRSRGFDRNVYERSSYGPPIYDKREHKIPSHSSYDRRIGYDKRGKYYREYCRPTDYEFEPYGESPDIKDRKLMYTRRDYENVYDDGVFTRGGGGGGGGGIGPPDSVGRGGSGIYKNREYFYSGAGGERRSFDRESMDSYESGSRRRKSFGSGDVYGSFDSREDFRERYLAEKSRSLRKGLKTRGGPGSSVSAAPNDYEPDSENDVQIRAIPAEREHSRSLQRPASGSRIRKSSGSSPWDGEEPTPGHSQKGSWKRPASASESERRLTAENRRVLSHNLSGGSDGEKDKRFRKKQRSRGKETTDVRPPPSGRYQTTSHRDNYDYVYGDYEPALPPPLPPTSQQPIDEDKFERLNRRRHDLNQRIIEIERRKRGVGCSSTIPPPPEKYSYDDEEDDEDDDDDVEATKSAPIQKYSITKKDTYYSEKDIRYARTPKFGSGRFEFDADFEETPRSSNASSSNKFNFEDQPGFESDFISSPPPGPPPTSSSSITSKTPLSGGTKSSFRFSNDFSTKHSLSSNFDAEFPNSNSTASMQITPTASTQKLRFDDKVTISKFDNTQPSNSGSVGAISDAFEDDDFSKAQFDFENEDQWNAGGEQQTQPIKRNNNLRLSGKYRSTGGSGGGGGLGGGSSSVTGNNSATNGSCSQHDHLRKSESVNIFAKKVDDPFEDDDFFKSTANSNNTSQEGNGKKNGNGINNGNNSTNKADSFQWDNNFAKFDENM